MSKPFNGSLCLSDLLAAAQNKHSAFTRSEKNGKVYANITMWENDTADDYGNTHSIQLNPKQGSPDDNKEGRIYIARAKPSVKKEPAPISDAVVSDLPKDDDLPF